MVNGLKSVNWFYPFYFEKVNKVKWNKWAIKFQTAEYFNISKLEINEVIKEKWQKKRKQKQGLKYLICEHFFILLDGNKSILFQCALPSPTPPAPALPPSRGSLTDSLGPQSGPFSDTFLSRPPPTSGPPGLAPAEAATHTVSLPYPSAAVLCMKENKQNSRAPSHVKYQATIEVVKTSLSINTIFSFFIASPTQLTPAVIPPLL